ncbi:MAG: helix-turn-helix domain-containing protein [Burkholderiales bacterium]
MNDDLNAPGAALVPPTTATDAILRPRERGIGIHQLAQLLGIPREHDPALETVTFPTRAVRERDVLVRAGDPCDSLYVVRCGCFKTSVLDAYGGIQGTGFPMTGDVIGADGLATGAYASDAVALDHGEVVVISVPRLGPLSRTCPAFPSMLYRMISREIVRDQSVLFLLGSLCAEARVAAFLLDLSDQFGALGYSRASFLLKMTRQDIGNYLGLTIETVSRAMSALAQAGCIDVRHRQVDIVDRARLKRIVTRSGGISLRAEDAKAARNATAVKGRTASPGGNGADRVHVLA